MNHRFHTAACLAAASLAVLLLAAPPAAAQPDMVITSVQVLDCGRVSVTMQNQGDQLNNTITAAALVAYPAGSSNQNVYRKNAFFSATAPGQSRTRIISGPSPNPPGGTGKQRLFTDDGPHTIQVVADGTFVVSESNENNNIFNTSHNASGCSLAEPCELSAIFSHPTYSNVPGTYDAKLTAKFTNSGGEDCPAKTLQLRRNSGGSPSGSASTVATAQLPAISAGQTKSVGLKDTNHPQTGTFTYSLQYQGGFSDANNGNHNPTKTLTFTMPGGGGGGGNPAGCDLQATFGTPNGSTLPGGGTTNWQVVFTNLGSAACQAAKIKLMRYTGTSCGGYGTQIGGSGGFQQLSGLSPNSTQALTFAERRTPRGGKYCYKLSYSPAFNDANNNNHRPQRKVLFQ